MAGWHDLLRSNHPGNTLDPAHLTAHLTARVMARAKAAPPPDQPAAMMETTEPDYKPHPPDLAYRGRSHRFETPPRRWFRQSLFRPQHKNRHDDDYFIACSCRRFPAICDQTGAGHHNCQWCHEPVVLPPGMPQVQAPARLARNRANAGFGLARAGAKNIGVGRCPKTPYAGCEPDKKH